MDNDPSTVPSGTTDAVAPPWTWLLVCALVTTGLSLAAAHAPSRIRLIGLFSIAFGAIIGWFLVQLATRLDTQPSVRLLGLCAVLFTVCGLIGCAWETFRLEQQSQSKSSKDVLAARMLEQMQGQGESTLEGPTAIQISRWMSFRRYLARRVQQLGTWPSPWPELFWIFEIMLAAITSLLVAVRTRHSNLIVPTEPTAAAP